MADSPFCIRLLGVAATRDFLYFLLPRAHTDLNGLMRRHGPLNEETIKWIAAQVFLGLEHIHSKGIIHRDIKSGNILVMETGVAISDFGLSVEKSIPGQRFSEYAGTEGYKLITWRICELLPLTNIFSFIRYRGTSFQNIRSHDRLFQCRRDDHRAC